MEDIIGHRLRNKKALIIVDDVDEVEQMEALCDRTWFGPGSRIIITSTDEDVLRRYADKIYQVKLLTNDEALQLFECRERPGECSRLWLYKDIIPVLENNKGTSAIESIFLKLPKKEEVLAP
ncbi:PREDICTED: NBS-LRR [Prunus dulcis]|uniref:PREDICTED: NBS-LRR n=1 Tax=Prunus dulcis TaxID=3755 RepID=A0A5E4EI66_PRUDU|nr:PREDICTED: NBS-LRR [Prunus dulcis]